MPLFRSLLFLLLSLFSQKSPGQSFPAGLTDSSQVMGIRFGMPVKELTAFEPLDSSKEQRQLKKLLIFYNVQYIYQGALPQVGRGWPLKYLACSVDDSGRVIALHFILEDRAELLGYLIDRYGPYDLVTGISSGGEESGSNNYFWYKPLCFYYLNQNLSLQRPRPGKLDTDQAAILTFSSCNNKQFIFDPARDSLSF